MTGVAESYTVCRSITRERAKNFYHGMRLAPEPKRSALYAVYAWMRRGDDIADEPGIAEDNRRAMLDAWADETEEVFAGRTDGLTDPIWPAVAEVIQRYPIEAAWFRDAIAGMRRDIDPSPIQTMDELREYCRCVASTVGRTCVAIWGLRAGVDSAEAFALAEERGIAFQLTNILRDVAEDFDAEPSRTYVPAEVLAREGLSATDLRSWHHGAACERVVQRLTSAASDAFDSSSPLDAMIDPGCVSVIRVMTAIYRRILTKIEQDPSCVVRARPSLSRMEKVRVVVGTRLFGPSASVPAS